jgi:hypothetical protein
MAGLCSPGVAQFLVSDAALTTYDEGNTAGSSGMVVARLLGMGVAQAGLTLHRPALPQRVSLRLLLRAGGRKLSGRDL